LYFQKIFVFLQAQNKNRKKMETQLVRLDAPYNIICGTNGEFALHIATLIVVKERTGEVVEGAPMRDTLSVASYPVVIEGGELGGCFMGAGKGKADGQVWLHTELKDCYVVCPQNYKTVLISELKNVMKYYAKQNMIDMPLRVATSFSWAMTKYGCKILLLDDENKKEIRDYEVCLEFEDSNGGQSCMVSADDDSPFYFYEFFENEPPFSRFVPTNSEAIKYMAELRDTYLQIFRYEGLRSIKFTTKNKDYLWFVDQLNATKADGE
jgi:hypothetical protein